MKTFISKEESTALKGFLAILVVLCHCRSYLSLIYRNEMASQIFVSFGYVSVGVFFFLSGNGVHENYLRSNKFYMHSFLRNRVLPLYVKYVLLVIGYIILLKIGGTLKPNIIIPSFFAWGGVTAVVNGWFFQITILLYLVFYFVYINSAI